ncbi:class I SAM-dependent methyltransferase [Acidobacteria bacterium AH-259-A15]|nr:class I SAM-dependent methyltransferase [Acidobacteria bacterium AH-259-A15]
MRLAQQDFHVIGLDRNPHMLAQAIRKAGERGLLRSRNRAHCLQTPIEG